MEEEGMETTLPPKNNSIHNSLGNEENGYPVPHPKKTRICVTKKPSDAQKGTLKEEISEKFMEKILDIINQNVQDALKKFQDSKNKEHEKIQKQINECREDLKKVKQRTL
jgi:mevalonate kinase